MWPSCGLKLASPGLEDTIKMDFKTVDWKGVSLAQDGETLRSLLFIYCYHHPLNELRSTD